MKKLLSLTLALIMALSCFGAAIPAQAANSANCVKVTVHGSWFNSTVHEVVKSINSKRSSAGYAWVTLDKTLTEIAQKRAAECLVYVDSDSTDTHRPNGDAVSSMITGYANVKTGRYIISESTVNALSSFISNFTTSNYKDYKSVGMTIVKQNNLFVFYYILSTTASSTAFTRTTDMNARYTFDLDLKYVKLNKIVGEKDGVYVKVYLKSMVYAGGLSSDYFEVSNDGLVYKSTNTSVAKTKVNVLYPKKNGAYTINSYNSSGKYVASLSSKISGLKTNLKLTWKSAKSSKKKTLALSWNKNISDANGYQIQYSTNKKFKKDVKTVTVKKQKTTSKTIKKLKSKKTYYVRIRAYINQGENEYLYSSWSATKKVKVK